ncbi:MAG: ThuA domain-containing protein [Thermoguttaceae bacterium]|nr:ThuA domain-containing protein [Thermoguttaceae bacterium]
MQRRDFIRGVGAVGLTLGLGALEAASFAAESEKKGRKILYFDLSTEWEHPPTVDEADGTSKAAKIVKKLGESLGYEVDCTKDGSVFDGDLSQYAAFVFMTCGDLDVKVPNRTPVSETGRANLFKAVRGGTGFLGIHCATDTWQCKGELFETQPIENRTEYIKMVGGDFITHGEMQEATLRFVEPIDVPTLRSFNAPEARVYDEWYCMKNFAPDMRVLVVQETKGMKNEGRNACYDRPPFPACWIRREGKGRVAYISPGHGNAEWETAFVQNLAKDMMNYVVGGLDLDETPNLKEVCPQAEVLRNPAK